MKLDPETLKRIGLTDVQLGQVRRMQRRIEKLDAEIDALINDPVTKAMQQCSCEEIDALVEALPRGFHRTELRAWRFKKFDRPGEPVLPGEAPA